MQQEQSFLASVGDTLLNAAVEHILLWIIGVAVSAFVALRAYMRGARGPLLYLPLGAAIGIGGVVILTALLVWSKPVFYLLIAGIVLAPVIRWITVTRHKRRTRIAAAEKGLFDYWEQNKKAQAAVGKAMAGISRTTYNLGEKVNARAAQFGRLKGLPEAVRVKKGKRLAKRAAREFETAASKMRGYAKDFGQSTVLFTEAMTGIAQWQRDNHGDANMAELLAAISSLKQIVSETLATEIGFKRSVLATPRMSQELSAAATELADAISEIEVTIRATLDFCDRTLGSVAD